MLYKKVFLSLYIFALIFVSCSEMSLAWSSMGFSFTGGMGSSPNLSIGVQSFGGITITTASWSCNNWPPQSSVTFDMNFGMGFVGGGGGCTPSCGSCTLPACPSGSDSTSRPNCAAPGTSCSRGTDGCGGSCGSLSRSCWYLENSPTPGVPTNIGYKLGSVSCNLGNAIRVPNAQFPSGDGFLASGGVNNRLGDIRGLTPLLQYSYRLPDFGLQSGLLGTSTRYGPSMGITGGATYTVFARSNSVNRCSGNSQSSEISRTFKVNNIPEVISIEPVEDPNGGVSGHIARSGASHDFPCDVDNPKSFRVVFEDEDGCGDLLSNLNTDTNICGGVQTPTLTVRAVDSTTGTVFSPNSTQSAPEIYNASCSGNQVTGYFDIEFLGDENYHLNIQGIATDIMGDSSGWQTRTTWSYDGRPPTPLSIDGNIIVGVDELNVVWSAQDSHNNLSGIRGIRILSRLNRGEVLLDDSDYGSILYEGTEVSVNNSLDNWVYAWNPGLVSIDEARARTSASATHLVDIGINQDGDIDFRLDVVDRACNYSTTENKVILNSPWIVTRGGLVHSGGDSLIAVKQSIYGDLLPDFPYPEERTSLSSELITVGGSEILGLGLMDHLYEIRNYTKRLTHEWYDILLSRANTRDPDGILWSEVNGSEVDVNLCKTGQHVYFVRDSLSMNPLDYEGDDLAPSGNLNGCLFVVRENVTIGAGEHKSFDVDPEDPTYAPKYDSLKAYVISDGYIHIEFADADAEVRDGLKVVGGLFATGGSHSIRLGRSLQLRDNLQFPTLIVFHDSRYIDLGRKVLGDTFGGGYIRDIGLKQ